MSGLHWLASSERERQQALELTRALQQKESRDELGIGSIRDGLADLLFPGTSTLHTRARYHLFIPWGYRAAVSARGSSSVGQKVRAAEVALIDAMIEEGDRDGLIGQDARASLKRMPSTLYWQGLHVWGVRRVGGPQSSIERLLARRPQVADRDDDGQVLDGDIADVWHRNLPQPPEGHPSRATFDLTFEEAEFLAERLRMEPGTARSALSQLVEVDADHREVAFVWLHPRLGELDSRTRVLIEQARRFSLLMHGATWLYNVILANLLGSDLEAEHRERLDRWGRDAEREGAGLTEWDMGELWACLGTRVPFAARRFAADWQAVLRRHGSQGLVDAGDARALIVDRERAMKKGNARTSNPKALAQWGGISSRNALDYRWSTARVLLDDIRRGLELADAPN